MSSLNQDLDENSDARSLDLSGKDVEVVWNTSNSDEMFDDSVRFGNLDLERYLSQSADHERTRKGCYSRASDRRSRGGLWRSSIYCRLYVRLIGELGDLFADNNKRR